MPRYVYECSKCSGMFEEWQLMAADPLTTHGTDCGGPVKRVILAVNTMGVGGRGQRTREVDATERQWDRDMPAYNRLRMEGHQPPGIDGAHALEAHATDDWYVKTGGKVSVPDARKDEVNEMLADGGTSDWSPVKQVHTNKGQSDA